MRVLVRAPVDVDTDVPVYRPDCGHISLGAVVLPHLGAPAARKPSQETKGKAELPLRAATGAAAWMCMSVDLGLVIGAVNIQRAYLFP